MGKHKGRWIGLLNDIGNGEGLAGSGNAQQGLKFFCPHSLHSPVGQLLAVDHRQVGNEIEVKT